MSEWRIRLLAALLCGTAVVSPAWAGGTLSDTPVPPLPSPAQIDEGLEHLGNPLNNPITGASEIPQVTGGKHLPSLEQLQATRPGDEKKDGLEPGRGEVLHQAALIYGAQGGLAARAFALNEMLRRYEAQLDATFDFAQLVVPLDGGQTLMRPPIVTEAQMAFALGDSGQVARETACIYQITREAELASAPPNWRVYLVRSWAPPLRPAEAALPRTDVEVEYWNRWVAEGWAAGEKQAVEIFLSDLGRLERDMVGMARYQVLLRAGLVEAPKVTFQERPVVGGRDALDIDDRMVRIADQPGLQADRSRWQPGAGCGRVSHITVGELK
jgi:defect-in-organelle-trafficking protein DotC